MAKVLVINAGSSSLRYQVIDMKNEKTLTKGYYERIGMKGSFVTHRVGDKKWVVNLDAPSHVDALNFVLSTLTDAEKGCLKSLDEISMVGHRVLHGGEEFDKATLITAAVIKKIEKLIPLGPLHQKANLEGIYACTKLLKKVPQVAVFDTAYHQTLPEKAFMYALQPADYTKYGIRKFGFHGTSHKFIASEVAKKKYLGKKGKVVVMHIGSGASISAINKGVCVDTTMGYTPLDGCIMGTRSGSVDPSILPALCDAHKFSLEEAVNYLNKSCGYLGMTGYSDARDVEERAINADGKYSEKEQKYSRLAMDMRVYSDAKQVGAYAVALGGLDAIVFTAGLGENDNMYRKEVCDNLAALGVKLDEKLNSVRGVDGEISAKTSKVKVYVIPTNEELQIARETKEVVEGK